MLMAISRTPYRVSFFGGGTDYPAWYRRHGGAVLSMAINKYCYIGTGFLPPFFGIRHRIIWSHIEAVGAISEILHPAVRAGLQTLGFDDTQGIELFHQGDLPARSGIGSSSAFAVGLMNVLNAMRGENLDAHALAKSAMDLEQNKLKESVGCQDQIASAYGGMNVIKFEPDNSFSVTPLGLSDARRGDFEKWLMLFYTGSSRISSEFAKKLISNLEANASPHAPHARDGRSGGRDASCRTTGRFRPAPARKLEAEESAWPTARARRRSTGSTTTRGAPARSAASCSAPAVRASWCSWFRRIASLPFARRCRISSRFPFRSISRARRSSIGRKSCSARAEAAARSDMFGAARKRAAKE